MASLLQRFFASCLVIYSSSMLLLVSSRGLVSKPPTVERLTNRFPTTPVTEKMSTYYGESHIQLKSSGSYADITLDKSSGSGLVSKSIYQHGFFSAAIKLPTGVTSGVVLAFYMSNSDAFPQNHDELDFELLGHEKRKQWLLQTNIYGKGSVNTGREEKFNLWFDPTEEFHQYSILWNSHHIVFLVDNIPVRELINNQASSSVYPSKPMSLYTTIWDASDWATHGGKYPVDYKYAPFVASIGEVRIEGCLASNTNSSSTSSCSNNPSLSTSDPIDGDQYTRLTSQQTAGLNWARSKHMIYSYCKDTSRYKVLPPEC